MSGVSTFWWFWMCVSFGAFFTVLYLYIRSVLRRPR